MKQKAVVEKQFSDFQKVLDGIESSKNYMLHEKVVQLVAVQQVMFVFVGSMENADYRRFRAAFDVVFARLVGTPGAAA